MALVGPVAGFEQGGAEETDLDDLAADAVDLNPVADANAVFAHEDEPAEEGEDEVLEDDGEARGSEAEDGGDLAGRAEDDKEHQTERNDLESESGDRAESMEATAIHGCGVEEGSHANGDECAAEKDEGYPCEGFEREMADDAVLELNLREPFGVDGGGLGLGFELVFGDVVHMGEEVGLLHTGYASFRCFVLSVGRVDRGCRGSGLLFEVIMFGGKTSDVGVGVGFGLTDKIHSVALIEPGGDAAGDGAVARGREDRNLSAAGLRVVLLHGGLAGGQFLLDLRALVTAKPGELLVGVGEFVVVELELGLDDVEVVGLCDGAVRLLEFGGEVVDFSLIFFGKGLELSDFLLCGEGFAGEGAGLEGSLTESESEGLIDVVIGEAFGFPGQGLLFRRGGGGRESGDSAPWARVEEGGRS